MLSVFPDWWTKVVEPRTDLSLEDRQRIKVVFRKSMMKFTSDDGTLELNDVSRFLPYHFNRQVGRCDSRLEALVGIRM